VRRAPRRGGESQVAFNFLEGVPRNEESAARWRGEWNSGEGVPTAGESGLQLGEREYPAKGARVDKELSSALSREFQRRTYWRESPRLG
jgi:hypothetical protein